MSEQEKRQRKPAIGYTRTSSAANIGEDKDSVVRQRKAIQVYANRAGYRIVEWYDDPAVTGADTIDARPGSWPRLKRSRAMLSALSLWKRQTVLPAT